MKSYLGLVSGTFDPSLPAFDAMLPAGLSIFLGCAGVLFFSVIILKEFSNPLFKFYIKINHFFKHNNLSINVRPNLYESKFLKHRNLIVANHGQYVYVPLPSGHGCKRQKYLLVH